MQSMVCSEMIRSPPSKAVLDDSWITAHTTSLHQHKPYLLISELYRLRDLRSRSALGCAGMHQRLRDSILAERKFGSGHRQNIKDEYHAINNAINKQLSSLLNRSHNEICLCYECRTVKEVMRITQCEI